MIIETDLGHDPDDFFAICWLVAAGVKIDALTLTPGDVDQIAFANFLRDELSLDCPIGVSKLNREKMSSGSIHYDLLKKYDRFKNISNYKNKHDGEGIDVLYQTFDGTQDFLVIGPATSTAKFLQKAGYENYKVNFTMQGGFLPKSQNPYPVIYPYNLSDKTYVQTFNFNGDIPATKRIIDTKFISKRFIGKHICHSVVLEKSRLGDFCSNKTRAADLFIEGMKYLFKHTDGKKFHDPLAAVSTIDSSPYQFIKASIHHDKQLGWTAYKTGYSDCEMIAVLDQEMFWKILTNFYRW